MNTTAVTLSTGTLEDTDLDTALENILATDTPWNVIVWNDPVNLMTYAWGLLATFEKVEN